MLLSYTLGKSTDDASGFFTSAGDPNFPQNSLDPGAERGRSSFDIRHRFSAAVARPLALGPFAKVPVIRSVFADIDLEAVVTLQSGRPFTVALLPDVDNSNTGRSNLGFGNNDRPNVSGSTSLAARTAEAWFNTKAFSMPPFGTFGNSGRNTLTGPRFQTINVAVVKHLRVSEFRVDRPARRSVQPDRSRELRSARRVLRIAHVRQDPLGAEPEADSVRCEDGVLIFSRGASPLGLPDTLSRAPLRRRASTSAEATVDLAEAPTARRRAVRVAHSLPLVR